MEALLINIKCCHFMHNFLATTQAITPPPRYIVVNQSEEDALRFNRAALINIGALEAERVGCDYMAIHDVDIGVAFGWEKGGRKAPGLFDSGLFVRGLFDSKGHFDSKTKNNGLFDSKHKNK
ncbi:hypothetical protein niasHS_016684 [Heterodera schachtii]|uniref:Gland protein n=1 Tax=Heterodera schachtii TaxID=97005 RepID=A0ABD2I2I8_HETSC